MLFLNPVQCKTGISFNQQYDNGNKDIRLYIFMYRLQQIYYFKSEKNQESFGFTGQETVTEQCTT